MAADDTVADNDVLTRNQTGAFQYDAVVIGIDEGVRNCDPATAVDIDAVVVSVGVIKDADPVDGHVFAVEIVLVPMIGVFEADAGNAHVMTRDEKDVFDPVLFLPSSFIGFALAAAVNRAQAADRNVRRVFRKNQRAPTRGRSEGWDRGWWIEKIVAICAGGEGRARLQVEIDVVLEKDRAGGESACRNNDPPSAVGRALCHGGVDGVCAQLGFTANRSEVEDVIRIC